MQYARYIYIFAKDEAENLHYSFSQMKDVAHA